MRYLGLKQSFSTLNESTPPHKIMMRLKEGPFRYLMGEWSFLSLDEHTCKINFSIEYDFESKLLQKIVGPVFETITRTLMDAFVERAKKVYTRL
jgi:ribosome-associated toxin RatA of RatAB toxin-antitoxin module